MMFRNALQIVQLSLLAIFLQGCALPLTAKIADVTVRKSQQLIYDQNGRPIEMLRASVRVQGAIDDPTYAVVHGYKCDADRFLNSVGASSLHLQNNVASLDFPIERSRGLQFKSYDLKKKAFDICIYISVPVYPLRRESNTFRIPSDQVSQSLN